MTTNRILLTLSALALATAPALAQNVPPLEYESSAFPNGSVTFYGQLNPTLQSIDDGFSSKTQLMDNSSSNSRVGFNLNHTFGDAGSLLFNFETALGLRGTASNQIGSTPLGWQWDKTNLRYLDFRWTANYGVISLGQGSMATDGAGTINVSGTTLANSISRSDFAGSVVFRGTDGSFSGLNVGDVFGDFDGSRRARIRYDTPSFSGFSLGAAYGKNVLTEGDEGTYYDVAGRYNTGVGSTDVQAALGYAWTENPGSETDQVLMASVGVELQNGLNASAAYGNQQAGGEGSYWYLNGGYTTKFLSQGDTAVSVDYYSGQDFQVSGSSSTSWGVGITQNFDAQNLEAYLGYISYSYDEPGADFADISTMMLGARWSF